MKHQVVLLAIAASLLIGCTGSPVRLGDTGTRSMPSGQSRLIESEACGFQLLLFIPINNNDRASRAYADLVYQAKGDYITDVQIKEEWGYAFIGTTYCTKMRATAISNAS